MRENTKHSPQRRIVAALGALTLGLIGVGGVAAPAMAANIDQDAIGSIIIHKGVQHGGTDEGSPTGTAPDGFTGLAGVQFTAYLLESINTASNSGWDMLNGWADGTIPLPASIVNGTACNSLPPTVTGQTVSSTGTPTTTLTNGSGQATIAGLSVGAYVVCETQSPSTVVDKAQPFIISIPYPDTATGGWLYNPHVYPKNGVASITKSITAQVTPNLGLGSTAAFPVDTTVPMTANGTQFTHFWVQDSLDPTLTGGTATVSAPGLTAAMYDVEPASAANGNTVTVHFNQAGLIWLKNNPGATIRTTFTATVTAIGAITNRAHLNTGTAVLGSAPDPDDPDTTPGHDNPGNPNTPGNGTNTGYPGTPSNQVTTNWGNVQIHKEDSATPATGLTGARFEVYAAQTPYPATAAECAIATAGGLIPVNGANDFTSTTGGVVSIPGLFVNDSVNSGSATFRCYVLKEIQAPVGYVLPTGDAAFTPVAVTVGATATGTFDATVPNTQISGVTLPMTGSDGIIVFSIAGAALLALGLVVATVSRRRRSHTA